MPPERAVVLLPTQSVRSMSEKRFRWKDMEEPTEGEDESWGKARSALQRKAQGVLATSRLMVIAKSKLYIQQLRTNNKLSVRKSINRHAGFS